MCFSILGAIFVIFFCFPGQILGYLVVCLAATAKPRGRRNNLLPFQNYLERYWPRCWRICGEGAPHLVDVVSILWGGQEKPNQEKAFKMCHELVATLFGGSVN